MEIINCKTLSSNLRDYYKTQVDNLKSNGVNLKLVVVLVGENPASQVYVRNKEKACNYVGINSETIKLPETITEEQLIKEINTLISDQTITALLVQLPLPKHINEAKILSLIPPRLDPDGLTKRHIGNLWSTKTNQNNLIVPCTPKGIIKILESINFEFKGKKAVVLGRSNIVGLPIAKLLLDKDCTVTICHSNSNISEACLNADLIISAVGKPKFLNDSIVKAPNAVIIDVGINRDKNGKLCGDVDIDNITCSKITPVPGGVGILTVTMLLDNIINLHNK